MLNENKHSESLIGHIILNAVHNHERQVGVGTLALILKGSQDKDISRRKLNDSPFFGALIYASVPDIEYMVKQLMKQGFIERHILNDFRYPVLVLQLTEEGKTAREQKRNFHLKFHAVRIRPTSNNTIEETFSLFQQTKDIARVAEQRQLAQSTIWGHLISCILMGKIKAEDLVSAEKIALIKETQQKLGGTKAKPIKEQLQENISYEEIRCVLAEMGIK
jgi:superfamily II DNA helicase RecQ